MTTRKTERILNLTICLLVSGAICPRAGSAKRSRHDLSDAAFERTFERDKDELRSLGVPIEVGSFDPLFDDEPGYRILPSEFELPPIDLDAEEAAVVGVARVWQHASMAESTTSAMAKLRAGASSRTRLSSEPWSRLSGHRIGLRTAVARGSHRIRVSFTYRDGACRTLEPWGMTSARGRWYVIGRDIGRDARGCSSSRIQDRPKNVSRPGAYSVPENLDLRLAGPLAHAASADRVRAARYPHWRAAPALRRRGTPSRATVALPGGFEVYSVGYSELRFVADEVVRYAADVIVLEPVELRNEVRRGLERVASTRSDRAGAA